MMEKANVKIFPDARHLSLAAVETFINIANQAVQERGRFIVALAGGSTPQLLYELLASEPHSERVDWSRTYVFWGDERCVPPDHPDSNYRKARETFLEQVPLPPENIFPIHGEKTPEQAAADYEERLLRFFSSLPSDTERGQASFDLVLLGMGDDGHTASLFPGISGLEDQVRWVIANYVDKLGAWRVTLTPALLNRARKILFLVSGAGKSYTLQRVIYGSYQPDRYPAQLIQPDNGELVWLIDESAAALF
jgi:6-phosphogluconolactonase